MLVCCYLLVYQGRFSYLLIRRRAEYVAECERLEEEEEREAMVAAQRAIAAVKRRGEKRKAGMDGYSSEKKKGKKAAEPMED